MTPSLRMGRPKIAPHKKFSLNLPDDQREALARAVESERGKRDGGFTTTAAIREAIAQWIAAHDPKAKRRTG